MPEDAVWLALGTRASDKGWGRKASLRIRASTGAALAGPEQGSGRFEQRSPGTAERDQVLE